MTTKTKIRALENHVLPECPEDASIYIKNDAEIALWKKANRIRTNISVDLTDLWHNNKLTLEEKEKKTMAIYNTLDPTEKLIVTKDENFYVERLCRLIAHYFAPMFPDKDIELQLRIGWFFQEMRKLGYAKHLEDSEWYHNRNEEAPDFNDFKWWDTFEAKLKQEYPDGIFGEKSYLKLQEWLDKEESKLMVQYWKEHPEAYKNVMEELKKQ